MKIMFIPDARNNNSYQTMLLSALTKQGATVNFGGSIISIIKYWPDILHIHWPNPYMNANGRFSTISRSTRFICELLLLKSFGMKIIWTVHNMADHEGKFKDLEIFFNKRLAMLCDKLIVHCSSAKEDVKNIYGKNISSMEIIPHGNYIEWYKNTITTSQARARLNIRDEEKVFLYFGQIRSYKGVPELINAFKKLNDNNIKLLIVGKPLNDEITKNILDSCKDNNNINNILEFIPDDDIQIYMNAADIVVLPYKNILTSGAAILSMSFGKPIIAPAIKCIADTLDGHGSFLYKDGNLDEPMRRVLNTDRETLKNMGDYNFRLAEQLGWEEIGKKTYGLYQKSMAR